MILILCIQSSDWRLFLRRQNIGKSGFIRATVVTSLSPYGSLLSFCQPLSWYIVTRISITLDYYIVRCIGQKFLEREAIRWKQPKNFPKSFAISLNNTGKASLSPRAFGIVLLFSYHIPSCTSPKLSSSLFQLLYPITKEEEASISSAFPKRVLVRKCVFAAATSLSFHSFVSRSRISIQTSIRMLTLIPIRMEYLFLTKKQITSTYPITYL